MDNGDCCAKFEDEIKLIRHTYIPPLVKNTLALQVYNFLGGVIFVQKHTTILYGKAL